MSHRSVILECEVIGYIWEPNRGIYNRRKAISNWDVRFASGRRPTLRDLAEAAVADGDFRECWIAPDSYFKFERREPVGADKEILRRKWVPVHEVESVRDLLADDKLFREYKDQCREESYYDYDEEYEYAS